MLAAYLALALAAEAPQLQQARAHMEQLDYRSADAVLTRLEKEPSLGPADVLVLFQLQGLVAASLGDEARAVAAFVRLLALRPAHRLSGSTTPKVARPFQQAQAQVARLGPLSLSLAVREHTGSIEAVDVVLTGASAGDVARVVARCTTPTGAHLDFDTVPSGGLVRLPCQGTLLTVHARALSAAGWTLIEAGQPDAPLTVLPSGVSVPVKTAPVPSVTLRPQDEGPSSVPADPAAARLRLDEINAELRAMPDGWGAGNVALTVIGSLFIPALVVGGFTLPAGLLAGSMDRALLITGVACVVGGIAGIVMAAVGVGNGTSRERTTRERKFLLNRERQALEAQLRGERTRDLVRPVLMSELSWPR